MTVRELVKVLMGYDPELPVAYQIFSEQCLLEAEDLKVEELCAEREDGWIPNKRPDKPTKVYLVFPGN